MEKLPVLFEGTSEDFYCTFLEELNKELFETCKKTQEIRFTAVLIEKNKREKVKVTTTFFTGADATQRFKGHFGY